MKKYIALAFVSIVAVSCSSDEDIDTIKPEITIITPTDHQEVEPGTPLSFKANLKDNVGLASYKIEIHSAEDGHQHRNEEIAFSYETVGSLSGTMQLLEKDIPVPANVLDGHYHVGIFVIDTAGNQNQQFIEVFIGEDHHEH